MVQLMRVTYCHLLVQRWKLVVIKQQLQLDCLQEVLEGTKQKTVTNVVRVVQSVEQLPLDF